MFTDNSLTEIPQLSTLYKNMCYCQYITKTKLSQTSHLILIMLYTAHTSSVTTLDTVWTPVISVGG